MKRLVAILALVLVLWFPLSAANKTVTVKPAGQGGTYTTLAGAIAGELVANANLVTMAGILTIEIDGTWSSADTTAVVVDGFTTSATYYLRIYTTTAARHVGVWNTGKYILLVSNASALQILDNYVQVDGLQITVPAQNAADQDSIYTTGDLPNISNCIIRGSKSTTYRQTGINLYSANGPINIWNCIVYDQDNAESSAGRGIYQAESGDVLVYSTTVIGGYRCFRQVGGGIFVVKNCYGGNPNADGQAYLGTTSMVTCGSSDTTGTAGLQNIAVNTTQFVNVSVGTEDFHLKGTGSALYSVGTNTSGDAAPMNFTTDIDAQTRDSTWDVGADAWYVAEGPAMINNILVIIGLFCLARRKVK